jgi:NAD(P)-dependent dehydrogenase (short-subunit alcohol dehydrogenase family)
MTGIDSRFDVRGRVAFITGAGGVLMGAMARELAARGVKVAAVDRSRERLQPLVDELRAAGSEAHALQADVLDRAALQRAADEARSVYGRIDILLNGAGGNQPGATTAPDRSFFDLPADALRLVVDLNLMGSVLPSQVVGRIMADQGDGIILNISSMNSFRPLTRIVGYSAAKAAINNFTQWLAVHLAQTCSPRIRVNAIAPGFFETAQNQFLLRQEGDGALTERGRQILDHTPMARFGVPDDLLGTLVWLVSPASSFVSGVVVPVDGGFSAYSGV